MKRRRRCRKIVTQRIGDLRKLLPPPETILRAIFAQALEGKPISLPAGATAADLRQAIGLDPDIMGRIFAEEKARVARRRQREVVFTRPPAASDEAGKRKTRIYRPLVFVLALSLAIAILVGFHIWRIQQFKTGLRDRPIDQLFTLATGNQMAFSILTERAQEGEPAAQFDLATLLDSHLEPEESAAAKDDQAAFGWYRRAAEAGFAPAQNNLGFAYRTGLGVPADPVLAAHWYLLAARQGLADAQNSVGYAYQTGMGVKQDAGEAVQWYIKAAAQGLAAGEANLAAAYEAGAGVARNIPAATLWFGRAAAQGEPNAQNSLGFLYYTGSGVSQNFAKAADLFAKSAAQGNPAAQVNLGLMYLRGQSVKQNNETAAMWFLLGAAHGDKDATPALALITPPLSPAAYDRAKAAARQWTSQHGIK